MGTPGSLGMNNGGTTDRGKVPTFGYPGEHPRVNPSAQTSDKSRTPESPFEHTRPPYFRQPYITEVENRGRGKGGRYPVTSADFVTRLPGYRLTRLPRYLEPTGQGGRIIRVHKKGPGEFCRSIKRTTAGRVDHVLTNTRTRARAYIYTMNNPRSDA